MWIGEVSTDNPRPYNPESNVSAIEVQELEFYFNDDMIIILEFIIDDNICFYYRIYKEVYYILYQIQIRDLYQEYEVNVMQNLDQKLK